MSALPAETAVNPFSSSAVAAKQAGALVEVEKPVPAWARRLVRQQ